MRKSISLIMAALAFAAVLLAPQRLKAADLPIRQALTITNTVPAAYTLPLFQGNGQLLTVQVVDARQTTNTCTIKHLIPLTSTQTITNTVATLTYTGATGVSMVVTNGPYLIAGDTLTGTFGTSSTGAVIFVRSLAK